MATDEHHKSHQLKKKKGLDLILGSKVGSTGKIFTHCGQIMAMPHKVNARPVGACTRRNAIVSEYSQQFVKHQFCHSGMKNKPLQPYNPMAYRSRNIVDTKVNVNRNLSSVRFDGGITVCHKRRFKTTQQVSYTGEPVDWRSNQGVLSLNTRLIHKSLQR